MGAGRKSLYSDISPRLLEEIGHGSTIKDACKVAGINKSTFFEWQNKYKEFADLVKKAQEEHRENIVSELEKSLIKKANGFKVTETKTEYAAINGRPSIVKQTKTEKEFAPDTAALVFALSNLAPEKWQNKQKQKENEVIATDFNLLSEGENTSDVTKGIEDKIRESLKNQNRYSPDLEVCINMAAGSYHAFLMALKEVQNLKSTCSVEISREGNERAAPHPAFKVLKDTQEMVRRSLCELGLTVKTLATDDSDVLEEVLKNVEEVE